MTQQKKSKKTSKKPATPKLKTKRISVEVDKVHALVIKEYDGMVIDIFTKKPVEMFMKPLKGYKVAKLSIVLEELPPLEDSAEKN